MSSDPILLDVLLRQRNWSRYGMFVAQYRQAARKVDLQLANSAPSRAQHHRWVTGQLRRLPHVDHCRVLEAMFPGWSAEQLFSPPPPEAHAAAGSTEPIPAAGAGSHTPGNGHGGSQLDAVATSPVSIRPYVDKAFTSEHVAIDFFGFSGETLHGIIQESLDKIRAGQLKPSSLAIRLLVPDTTEPLSVPCRVDDLGDSPEFRARAQRILFRHGQAILDSVQELTDRGAIEKATAEIRVHNCEPLFKLYILNHEDVFFGFYPITEHAVTINGKRHNIYDLMGKDTTLIHHSANDPSPASVAYVAQAREWYDTLWTKISREFTQ